MTVANLQLRNLDHGFDVPVGEVGVTVRNGHKWSVTQGLEFNLVEQYSDPDLDDKVVGQGKVLGFWQGKFKNLPDSLLSIEHNNQCRNYFNLLHTMETAYPGFTEDSEVTALIYERIQ